MHYSEFAFCKCNNNSEKALKVIGSTFFLFFKCLAYNPHVYN